MIDDQLGIARTFAESAAHHARSCSASAELIAATLMLARIEFAEGDTSTALGRARWAAQSVEKREQAGLVALARLTTQMLTRGYDADAFAEARAAATRTGNAYRPLETDVWQQIVLARAGGTPDATQCTISTARSQAPRRQAARTAPRHGPGDSGFHHQ